VNRSAVAVALLVLLSGCNAFGGAPEPTPEETVTPVDVPTDDPVATTTETNTPGNCVAPRPAAAPGSTPAPRAEPITLPDPDGDGAVTGRDLTVLHGRALSNYSYHLRTGSTVEVWSLPDAAAFTSEGVGFGVGWPWAYAVGGRLYTLRSDRGDLVFSERPYGPDSATRQRLASVLTGEQWLLEQTGPFNYTVVDTREYDNTSVRVLRDTTDEGLVVESSPLTGALLFVNSTLYVDDHGIVRHVRHVEQLRYGPTDDIPNRTTVRTLAVDRVGTVEIHRPAAFCASDPDVIRSETSTHRPAVTATSNRTATTGVATARPTPYPEERPGLVTECEVADGCRPNSTALPSWPI